MNFLKYRKISLSFLILSIALVSVHSYADELSSKVTSLFREPNAELTKFKYSSFAFLNKQVYEFPELFDKLKNSTVIYGSEEIKSWEQGRKISNFLISYLTPIL